MKQKKYISVDIEASGKTPMEYSMVSIGACIVGDTSKQFYREVKPISRKFELDAMKVASAGLYCLADVRRMPEYNPKHRKFDPLAVLKRLEQEGKDPGKVMLEFKEWAEKETRGYRPVLVAAPASYDIMWTSCYFDKFNIPNPFGHSGEDINSFYRGVMGDRNAHISKLKTGHVNPMPHNALQDAIEQAKAFERVLYMADNRLIPV